MISALELRHIIESGLLPRSCTCTVNPKGALLIKMIEPSSGHAELFVPGVLASALTSSRAISNLIGELKIEMAARKKICVSAAVNAGLAASDPPSHIDSSFSDGVIRLQEGRHRDDQVVE